MGDGQLNILAGFFLEISIASVRRWRRLRTGPMFVKIGAAVVTVIRMWMRGWSRVRGRRQAVEMWNRLFAWTGQRTKRMGEEKVSTALMPRPYLNLPSRIRGSVHPAC